MEPFTIRIISYSVHMCKYKLELCKIFAIGDYLIYIIFIDEVRDNWNYGDLKGALG